MSNADIPIPRRLFKYLWPDAEQFRMATGSLRGAGPLEEPPDEGYFSGGFLSSLFAAEEAVPFVEQSAFGDENHHLALTGQHIVDFVESASDVMLLLALAGYHVKALELGVLWHNDSRLNKSIRVELDRDYPVVKVQAEGVSGVRFYTEPVQAYGADAALPITESDVRTYMSEGGALLDERLSDFSERLFAPQAHPNYPYYAPPMSIAHEHFSKLVEWSANRLVGIETKSDFLASYWLEEKARWDPNTGGLKLANELDTAENTRIHMEMVNATILTPLAMFLGWKVGKAAATHFDNPATRRNRAPHGLWVLDPKEWAIGEDLLQAAGHPDNGPELFDLADQIRNVFSGLRAGMANRLRIVDETNASATYLDDFSDQVEGPQESVTEEWEIDPSPQSSQPNVEVGMDDFPLYAVGYAFFDVVTQAGALPSPDYMSFDHFGQQPHISEVLIQRLAFRNSPALSDKAGGKVTPASVPNLRKLVNLLRDLDKDLDLPNGALSNVRAARNNSQLLERTAEAASGDAEGFAGLESDLSKRDLRRMSAARLLFRLFDEGLFSIAHHIGGALAFADEQDEEADYTLIVEGSKSNQSLPYPDNIFLRLEEFAEHRGIHISCSYGQLPYDINRAVTWQYVPPVKPLNDIQLEAARRLQRPQSYWPTLLIAAAPGVSIDISDWPHESVIVEIVRLQSIERMPVREEPIRAAELNPPQTVTVDDLIDIEWIDNNSELSESKKTLLREVLPGEWYTNANGEKKYRQRDNVKRGPKVQIQPYTTPGDQGYFFSFIDCSHPNWPMKEGQTSKYEDYNGGTGVGAVKVQFPLDKATSAFSYYLEPVIRRFSVPRSTLDAEQPALGAGRAPPPLFVLVDRIGFRLVIHHTADVQIEIDRSHSMDAIEVVCMKTKRRGISAVNDIAPWGTPLEFTKDAASLINAKWAMHDQEQGWGEHTSAGKFQYNPAPETKYYSELLVDRMKFAIDLGIGFIPVVGDVSDLTEFTLSLFTGTDKWGQPITWTQRAFLLGGVVVPFASGKAFEAAFGSARALEAGADGATALDGGVYEHWLDPIFP